MAAAARPLHRLRREAPKKFSSKLLKEVDKGTRLEVAGKTHKNCCMPLSLARAILGPDAKQAEVHAWAAAWVEKFPENKQKACRAAANEANLGEVIQAKVIFVIGASGGKTRVWGAEGASINHNILSSCGTKVSTLRP